MIKCEKAEELIQHYLDLSLSHDQRIQLDRHVDSCSHCRLELQSYKKLMELVEGDEAPALPENYTQVVMQRLPDLEFSRTSHQGFGGSFDSIRPYLKVLGLAVAAVFVLTVMKMDHPFHFFSRSQSNPHNSGSTLAGTHDKSGVKIVDSHDRLNQTGLEGQNHKLVQNQGSVDRLVLKVTGGVVHIKGESGFQLVQDGESRTLNFRDEIRTGAKASASLEYPDEKLRLALKPGTRLQIARNSLRLFHGNTWVHVVKKGTNFEVRTPNLIAAVRGTVFAVETSGKKARPAHEDPKDFESKVLVFEGRVEVRSATKDQESVNLMAGQSVRSLGLGLAERAAIDSKETATWSQELSETGLLTSPNFKPEDNKPTINDLKNH